MIDEKLLKEVTEKANQWLGEGYDEETKAEVKRMLDNDDKTDLVESFYKNLEFGTGGLRGIMGAGSNRMNIYTVGAATQGLANYLKDAFKTLDQIKVVVGHDVRNNSRKFAETVASIFSANGIKVYLFEDCRPTPELSYAVRLLGCQSGVNITASHNPKEYNGYKAYWDDGAQVVSPHDVNIIDYVNRIKDVTEIKFEPNPELIQIIGEDIDNQYIEEIAKLSLSPEIIKKHSDLKIVYTPIHGTGKVLIPRSLERWGFRNIIHVPEQDVQSGDFPTVDSPNPENASAMAMAIKKAEEVDADIVMASDPDADRIGLVLKNTKGKFELVNGNQIQLIFHYYLLARNKELGNLTGNEYIVKTIVTTEVIAEIAKKNNVELRDCYTGFKWIAREIAISEGKQDYIGGGEESFGFLPYDKVRDKDAPASICLICEIAAWAKDQGKTLYDLLMQIYAEYGFSKEFTVNVVRPGKTGADEIKQMMSDFRANPPQELGGSKVVTWKDYQTLEEKHADGSVEKLNMPTTSNVLQWFCDDNTKVSVRPSGTEPKIKFYIEVKDSTFKCAGCYNRCTAAAMEKIEAIKKSLNLE